MEYEEKETKGNQAEQQQGIRRESIVKENETEQHYGVF